MGSRELKTVHMIGNAHIDPVWLWQWPEGYQEVRATFRSAVDRLDEYPEYVFTCDSSLFFAWVAFGAIPWAITRLEGRQQR